MNPGTGAYCPRPSPGSRGKATGWRRWWWKFGGYTLVLPAAILVAAIFLVPLLGFLAESTRTAEVRQALPRTSEALRGWDRKGLPPDPAFLAMAADLRVLTDELVARLGRRLNTNQAGLRSLVIQTREALLANPDITPEGMKALDGRWGDQGVWSVFETETRLITPTYLLTAVDWGIDQDGSLRPLPEDRMVFQVTLGRTYLISLLVTVGCVVFGFPLAYAIASAPRGLAQVMLILVLLPFWTSALVRSTAWVVLLQREGLVNQLLINLRVIDTPASLIFNRLGVLIAMVHVQLPLFVLPLIGVMKRVSKDLLWAAASLGAPPRTVFVKVYLPQVMPGIAAGALLVFTVSLGYYITPALVGGPGDQMLSWFIAIYTNQTANWEMASALALILVLSVGIVLCLLSLLRGSTPWRAG